MTRGSWENLSKVNTVYSMHTHTHGCDGCTVLGASGQLFGADNHPFDFMSVCFLTVTVDTSGGAAVEEELQAQEGDSQEELSQGEEEVTLGWIKELQVLPMEHEVVMADPSTDQPDYNISAHDVDYILGNLEVRTRVVCVGGWLLSWCCEQ